MIGKPGSEYGGEKIVFTHMLTNEPHWLGRSEREIFSQIAFVDFGYFYDYDQQWYYIKPGPFRIKMPLELVYQNLNKYNKEYDFLKEVEKKIIHYIFKEYPLEDNDFRDILKEGNEDIYNELINVDNPLKKLWKNYKNIFEYFDDWVLVETDEAKKYIKTFKMKKKSKERIETIEW